MDRYTFKAKRKDNGEWVYGDLIHTRKSHFGKDDENIMLISSITNSTNYNEVLPETLCQCTGLQDFYEHDLVKYEDEDEIYEILWFDEDCYFGLKGKGPRDTEMLYYKDIFKYLKLLGNKFDKEVE